MLYLKVLRWLPLVKCNTDDDLNHSTNNAGKLSSYIICTAQLYSKLKQWIVMINSVFNYFVVIYIHFLSIC